MQRNAIKSWNTCVVSKDIVTDCGRECPLSKRVEIREYDDARLLTAQAVAFRNGTLGCGTELDWLRVVARLYRKSRTRDVTSLMEKWSRGNADRGNCRRWLRLTSQVSNQVVTLSYSSRWLTDSFYSWYKHRQTLDD